MLRIGVARYPENDLRERLYQQRRWQVMPIPSSDYLLLPVGTPMFVEHTPPGKGVTISGGRLTRNDLAASKAKLVLYHKGENATTEVPADEVRAIEVLMWEIKPTAAPTRLSPTGPLTTNPV